MRVCILLCVHLFNQKQDAPADELAFFAVRGVGPLLAHQAGRDLGWMDKWMYVCRVMSCVSVNVSIVYVFIYIYIYIYEIAGPPSLFSLACLVAAQHALGAKVEGPVDRLSYKMV